MLPLQTHEIRGNWATLLLPVNADNTIHYSKLEEEIDIIPSMQVNGIYSNGTAGEFESQTEDEFDKINLLLAEKCHAANMPFQIGCSHTSPVISLERVNRARSLKPGAIQVILPDWYPPRMDEIIDYLQIISKAADPIGLVIYNPPHAKRKLVPEDYNQIIKAGIPIVGCKVAGGDGEWYAKMKRLVPGLSLFVPGHTLASGFSLGANGSYSNVACLHPGVAQQWYEMMLTNIDSAIELENRIQLFINDHIVPYIFQEKYSSQAVDKLLAAIGGWADIGTRLRWPYHGINNEEVLELRKECQSLIPEFF